MAVSEELIIKVSLNSKQVVKSVKVLDKSFKKLKKSGKEAETTFDKLGKAAKSVALPMIALNQGLQLLGSTFNAIVRPINATINAFRSYETALVGVGKTTGIAGEELQAFGLGLTNLSKKIPVTANELLGIAQVAGQLGIQGADDLTKFSETIARVTVATNLSAEEASLAFARILSLTDEPIQNVDRLASSVVALGNSFKTNEKEITKVALELAKSTRQFGLSSAQVVGLGTALAEMGTQAQLGSSVVGKSLRQIRAAIDGGSESLNALAEVTGITADKLDQAFRQDAAAVFQSFVDGIGKLDQSVVSSKLAEFGLIGDEVSKVIPALAKGAERLSLAFNQSSVAFEKNQALLRESDIAFKTLDSQIQITKNIFSALQTTIGQALAPVLTDLLKIMQEATIAFQAAFVAIKAIDFGEVAKSIGIVLAVMIPFLAVFEFTTAIAAIGGLSAAIDAMGGRAVIIKALGANFRKLGAQIKVAGKAGLKFILVAAGIATAAVAVDFLVRNFDKLGEIIDVAVAGAIAGFRVVQIALKEMSIAANEVGLSFAQAIGDKGLARGTLNTLKKLNVELSELNEQAVEAGAELEKSLDVEFDTGLAGQLAGAYEAFAGSALAGADNLERAQAAAQGTKDAINSIKPPPLTKEQLDLIEQLRDQTRGLQQDARLAGLDGLALMKAQQAVALENFDIQAARIREQSKGIPAVEAELTKQRDLLAVLEQQKFAQSRQSQIDGLIEATSRLRQETELAGLAGIDLAAMQRDLALEAFEAEAARILALSDGDAAVAAELDKQRELLKVLQDQKMVKAQESDVAGQAQQLTQFINAPVAAGLGVAFGSAFGDEAGPAVQGAVEAGAALIGDIVGGIADGIGAVVGGVATLFDPSFWNGIADSLEAFITKIPDALIKVFAKLPAIFEKFISQLPSVVTKILQALPRVLKSILDMMPQFVQAIFDALGQLVQALPAIVQQLLDALPGILQKLLDNLPELINKILVAVPQIINSIIRALPGLIIQILDALPSIIESLVSGLVGAAAEIAVQFIDTFIIQGGAMKIAIALAKAMAITVPIAIVKGIISGLKRGLDALFNGVKIPIPAPLANLGENIKNGLKDAGEAVQRSTSQIFGLQDLKDQAKGADLTDKAVAAIAKATEQFSERAKSIFDRILELWRKFWAFIKMLWDKIIGALRAVWDFINEKIIQPLIAGIRAVWQFVMDKIITPIIAAIRAVWQFVVDKIITPLIDGLMAVWNFVVKNIINPLIDGLMAVWDFVVKNIINPWVDGLRAIFNFAKQIFDLWIEGGKALFAIVQQIFDAFVDGGKLLFEGVKKIFDAWLAGGKIMFDALAEVFNNFKVFIESALKPIFEGLKSAFDIIKGPFETLATALANFKLPNLSAGGFLSSTRIGGTTGSVAEKGKKQINRALGRADGGMINGVLYAQDGTFAPQGTDTIPAMLTPGEFVVNREATQNNLALLALINKEKNNVIGQLGSGIGFQNGGMVGAGAPMLRGGGGGGGPTSNVSNVTVNLKIETTSVDQNEIRSRVIPAVKSELRRASLEGEFIMSKRGIRN